MFIFGEMRSGTDMLLDAIARHPASEYFNESDDEAFVDYELLPLDGIERLIDRSRAQVVAFKPIADSHSARQILDRFAIAKALWIYRRYPDAVNSALKLFKQHNEYIRIILEEPETARWRARNLGEETLALLRRLYAQGLSEASARSLIWYMRNNLYFEQALDSEPRALLLKYEHLVANPNAVFRWVADFLDLPFHPAMGNRVFRSSVNKEPGHEIEPEIEDLCEGLQHQLDVRFEAFKARTDATAV